MIHPGQLTTKVPDSTRIDQGWRYYSEYEVYVIVYNCMLIRSSESELQIQATAMLERTCKSLFSQPDPSIVFTVLTRTDCLSYAVADPGNLVWGHTATAEARATNVGMCPHWGPGGKAHGQQDAVPQELATFSPFVCQCLNRIVT